MRSGRPPVSINPIGIQQASCLLSPDEVAARLAVSRSLIYKLIRTNDLSAVYVGRLPRIEPDALNAYIERQRVRREGMR